MLRRKEGLIMTEAVEYDGAARGRSPHRQTDLKRKGVRTEMKKYNLCIIGFGTIGRALVETSPRMVYKSRQ